MAPYCAGIKQGDLFGFVYFANYIARCQFCYHSFCCCSASDDGTNGVFDVGVIANVALYFQISSLYILIV